MSQQQNKSIKNTENNKKYYDTVEYLETSPILYLTHSDNLHTTHITISRPILSFYLSKALLPLTASSAPTPALHQRAPHSTHLDALSLLACEGRLHHAVVLAQHPRFVDELHVVAPGRGDAVARLLVLAGLLGRPLRVVDVEDHVAFAHVEVPGDDRGSVNDLDEQLLREGLFSLSSLMSVGQKRMRRIPSTRCWFDVFFLIIN